MKIYKLPQLADSNPSSEYRLGPENSSAGSVYMVYGRIRPGEGARKIACAAGHEEIICVVKGAVSVQKGKSSFTVTAGEAFHAAEGETLYLETVGSDAAVYMAAGSLNAAAARPAQAEKRVAAPAPEAVEEAPDFEDAEDAEDEFEITTEDEPGPEDEKDIG